MSDPRHKWTLRFRLFLATLVATSFGLAALGPARQALEQRRAIEIETRRLSLLKSTNDRMEKDLARLNDQEYLEKTAREQLGLVKPGETSYIVERPPAKVQPKPPPPVREPWHREALDRLTSLFR